MECTQRLECTQELYESSSERVCPEQIGFLGICGVKHPVKKGPNKIGRDPKTCNIVLNLNSISRQHAVINVLDKEIMLMDLDSANKTKLMNKTLQPYIPHSLNDGDMVQFGDIFGVFRLLEDDNDLPMTQAIDIPDTPISTKHISRLNKAPTTTIPESPDVSDRDDSFVAPSQPKGVKCFKGPNSNFIKPSSKVISIQPVGSNKIDNVYWSSSKRSVSLNSQLDDSGNNLNNSTVSNKSIQNIDEIDVDMKKEPIISNNQTVNEQRDDRSIYEMETQVHFGNDKMINRSSEKSIYDMETQALFVGDRSIDKSNEKNVYEMETQVVVNDKNINEPNDKNIYEMETQAIFKNEEIANNRSIYDLETQALTTNDSISSPATNTLPDVRKINDQHEMQINLFTSKNEDERLNVSEEKDALISKVKSSESDKGKSDISADEILFDEIESEEIADNLDSQPLLPLDTLLFDIKDGKKSNKLSPDNVKILSKKFRDKISSDQEECEDITILPTQKIVSEQADDDDLTDCEEMGILPLQKQTAKKDDDEDLTDCEDLFEDIPNKTVKAVNDSTKETNVNFEDMLTQVIDDVVINKESIPSTSKGTLQNDISDMPTQVLKVYEDKCDVEKENSTSVTRFEDQPTQIIVNETSVKVINEEVDISPFKIPLQSPLKVKRKDNHLHVTKTTYIQNKSQVSYLKDKDDDINYYAATQDILNDLCSQRELEPASKDKNFGKTNKNVVDSDDEVVPCSVVDYETGDKFLLSKNNLSPKKSLTPIERSSESSDEEDKINKFVTNLSSPQIREVIGVGQSVDKVKRVPSDPSDVESTPKKVRPIKFMDIDLPNSQEIKTSVSLHSKAQVTESSSDSDTEQDSEEQYTPILFRKTKRPKVDSKINLTKKFEAETLPSRVITRVRKPPAKFQGSVETSKIANNILKPKFLTEQEDEIDKDIVNENIFRLKTKNDKSKDIQENKKTEKVNENQKNTDGKKNDSKAETLDVDKICNIRQANSNEDIKDNLQEGQNDIRQKKEIISKGESSSFSKDKTIQKTRSNRKTDENVEADTNVAVRLSDENVINVDEKDKLTQRSTRSTRNRRRVESKKDEEKSSTSNKADAPQKDDKSKKSSTRKRVAKKIEEIDLTVEGETDGRRTTRQKKSRDKMDDNGSSGKTEKNSEPPKKRGRPRKHEQSTVYSISSESGTDSPTAVKRSATSDLDPPSPKRTRAVANTSNYSMRSTPARLNKTHYVLLTAFPCEEVKAKLEKLGAVIVEEVASCTVVVTLQVKRTFKLLCGVGLGRPVVGPAWVQACADSGTIVDPWLYILKDEESEKKFKFNLRQVLLEKRKFLKGYNVSSTPNVSPKPPEMKQIVECSGGTWKTGGPRWVCVSCMADHELWPALKRRGAIVVSAEFILSGVLKQCLNFEDNLLPKKPNVTNKKNTELASCDES